MLDDTGAALSSAVSLPAKSTAMGRTDAPPLVVLKFGSSVLRSVADLPDVVSEIYCSVRAGRRVIAIVSAFEGVTDELFEDVERLGAAHDPSAAPAYVATGEETTAALLGLACDRAGLSAIALKTGDLGIIADGDPLDAAPYMLRPENILRAFQHHDVVIGPGFTATNALGHTVLLGRGGSDLSAVFLGRALGAERVRLLKDVDGVYEADPALSQKARRFARIDWNHASAVAGALVQPKALAFAAENELTLEVGALGARDATIIAAADGVPALPRPPRRLRVALAGLGTVGCGVAARLMRQAAHFEIVGALVRDTKKARDIALDAKLFCTSAEDLLNCAPDIVVDVLSDGALGARLSEDALSRGMHVVSANKQAIAARYHDLRQAASRSGSRLLYSAAVGGAAPILERVRMAAQSIERSAPPPIYRIEGVLNGTVNFVLARLAHGETLANALAGARAAGLAEEDATLDLSGADALAKLQLIALEAFGVEISKASLQIEALDTGVAERAALTPLKQISRIMSVGDTLCGDIVFEPAQNGPFSAIESDRNAVLIYGRDGQQWRAKGRGAGRWPTTESVFADLLDMLAP